MIEDKLSICITVKNRSKEYNLFPNCIDSIKRSLRLIDNVELIITDWESTDMPIRDWLSIDVPIHLITIHKKDGLFSVGKGRNIAAEHATGDILLFLDADMQVTLDSFRDAYTVAKQYGICYPPVLYQQTQGQEHWDLHTGGGNLFVSKELFNKSGKWPEYWDYGFEDIDFVENLKKITKIHTSSEPFYHQWHPKQFGWNKQVKPEDKQVVQERKEYYQKQVDNDLNKIKNALKYMIERDPNTTHSQLNISKGEYR